MPANEMVIVQGQHIIDNLSIINKNMDGILGRVVDPPLKKFMRSYTQQNLKPYPPKPAGSTYVRTKELYRSWDVESNRRIGEVKIVNTIDYARYVIGDDQQWYHDATGWVFLSDEDQALMRGAVPVITKHLDSEIRRFLFKKGLV